MTSGAWAEGAAWAMEVAGEREEEGGSHFSRSPHTDVEKQIQTELCWLCWWPRCDKCPVGLFPFLSCVFFQVLLAGSVSLMVRQQQVGPWALDAGGTWAGNRGQTGFVRGWKRRCSRRETSSSCFVKLPHSLSYVGNLLFLKAMKKKKTFKKYCSVSLCALTKLFLINQWLLCKHSHGRQNNLLFCSCQVYSLPQ